MVVHGFVFAYFGTTQFSCCIVWYCMVLYYSLHYCMVLHCCLRRAGCISQDTFLLYLISLQLSSFRISFNEIAANNSFPSCAQLSDGRVSSCGHQPHPPRPNMKLLCKTFQYAFKYDTSWCYGRICAPCLNSRSGINLPPPPILAGHNSFCPLWKIFAGLPPIIEKRKSSRSVRICSILLMNSDMWKVRLMS